CSHLCAGILRPEVNADAFIGLDTEGNNVGIELLFWSAGKQSLRRALEVNAYLRQAARESLAGADIKGHARPAPIIDEQLERDVGLSGRMRIDSGLLAIARNALAIDNSGTVLSA